MCGRSGERRSTDMREKIGNGPYDICRAPAGALQISVGGLCERMQKRRREGGCGGGVEKGWVGLCENAKGKMKTMENREGEN